MVVRRGRGIHAPIKKEAPRESTPGGLSFYGGPWTSISRSEALLAYSWGQESYREYGTP